MYVNQKFKIIIILVMKKNSNELGKKAKLKIT